MSYTDTVSNSQMVFNFLLKKTMYQLTNSPKDVVVTNNSMKCFLWWFVQVYLVTDIAKKKLDNSQTWVMIFFPAMIATLLASMNPQKIAIYWYYY